MFSKEISLASLFPKEYLVTFGMCLLGCLTVALVMRFVVKTALVKLDKYVDEKHPSDKVSALYKTVKAIAYVVIAFLLTAYALAKLMAICPFPADNNKALAMFYFVPMYAIQWYLDAHMRKLASKVFGLPYEEEEKPVKEKPVKERKQKIYSRRIKYTVDDEGNEVPLEQ